MPAQLNGLFRHECVNRQTDDLPALQKVELDRDYVVETMEIDGRTYTQKQVQRPLSHCQRLILPTVLGVEICAVVECVLDHACADKQVEGCFSQPNGLMCQKMVGWAVDVTRGSKCALRHTMQPALRLSHACLHTVFHIQ